MLHNEKQYTYLGCFWSYYSCFMEFICLFLSYRCLGEGDIKVYGLDYTGFCKLKKIAKREKINKKKIRKYH